MQGQTRAILEVGCQEREVLLESSRAREGSPDGRLDRGGSSFLGLEYKQTLPTLKDTDTD